MLFGFGINCEKEMAYALSLCGADKVDIVHIKEIMECKKSLLDYNFLAFPGGFLDGDDLGAAKACANRFKYEKKRDGKTVFEDILEFISENRVIIGICNGFQLLVRLGILPNLDGDFSQQVTLYRNDSCIFENRWVRLLVNENSPCIFTKGIKYLYLPIRHGEGKFFTNEEVLSRILKKNLATLFYTDPFGKPTERYPDNPNGSLLGIAGICDETGRVFGLMPHPEAYLHFTHHPSWTRGIEKEYGDGFFLLKNGVNYLRGEM